MTPKPALLPAFTAAAAFAALAALAPEPAAAAEVACRENRDHVVEVDGEVPADARFYESDTNGTFLVDIPSRSRSVLIDLTTGRAVLVPRTSLRTEPLDGTVRVREPRGPDTPRSTVAIDGAVMSFAIDGVKVRILEAARRAPGPGSPAGSPGAKGPASGAVPAAECLRIESRPVAGVPGCGKFV